jgi:hypothetical protein
MSENGRAPTPTELVYVPEPSWTPVFVAFGLAGLAVGVFAGWVWALAGGVLALLALRKWVKDTGDDLRRLPRHQDVTTAPLPATPMRSARES